MRYLCITLVYVLVGSLGSVCGFRRVTSDSSNYNLPANVTHYGGQEPDLVYSSIQRRLSGMSSDSHLIKNLPGLSDSIKQYAGHITIDPTISSNIFYWLFEPEEKAETLPLIIWMNGGPGCSSMDGLWLELGPLRLDPFGKVVSLNKDSWHNAANILFVDQPVGTGFAYTKSKTGYASNDDMINTQFYAFLTRFFALHPRYVTAGSDGKMHSRPFFMSGESHAGHYIPTIAKYILDRNDDVKAGRGDLVISLEGIALGNPWLDPFHQYDASDFAHGLGIINQGQKHRLKELEKKCQSHLKGGKLNNPTCFSLLDKIVDSTAAGGTDRVLMYDARKYMRHTSSFPPGHETLEVYLNRADVKQAIHATGTPHKFQECSDPPFYALSHQDGKGVTKELTNILDRDLRVLVFAGQYDLICNHIGIEKVLRGLAWKHQRDWLMAAPAVWGIGGKPAGFVRAHKNLEYLIVLDAGHMVPMDQPEVSLNMIRTFLQNNRFGKVQSKLGVALFSPLEDGSANLQCPRTVEKTTIANASQSSDAGDTLMDKLSFWSGAKKKSGTGNLRKQRPRPPQKPARRASTDLEANLVETDHADRAPADFPSPVVFDSWPFAMEAQVACCASIEFLIQEPSANSSSWASPDRLVGPHLELLEKVLQSDLDHTIQSIIASQATPDKSADVTVHAHFGRAVPTAGDVVVWEGNQKTQVDSHTPDMSIAAEVCGAAGRVRAVIETLTEQAKDRNSVLRAGLLTSHLQPQVSVVVAHQRSQPRGVAPTSQ